MKMNAVVEKKNYTRLTYWHLYEKYYIFAWLMEKQTSNYFSNYSNNYYDELD